MTTERLYLDERVPAEFFGEPSSADEMRLSADRPQVEDLLAAWKASTLETPSWGQYEHDIQLPEGVERSAVVVVRVKASAEAHAYLVDALGDESDLGAL